MYVAEDLLEKGQTAREYAHLILLAKNNEGYKNLMRLCSIASVEGFYYKPRVDYKTIAEHKEGLICLSACIAGDIPQLLLSGQKQKAYELASMLKEMGRTLDEGGLLETEEFYLKSGEQMSALFGDVPEAIENTVKIAEQCNVEIEMGRIQLPVFDVPSGYTNESYLEHLVQKGLLERYGQERAKSEALQERAL